MRRDDDEDEADLEEESMLGATVVYSAQGPATLSPDVWGRKRFGHTETCVQLTMLKGHCHKTCVRRIRMQAHGSGYY
jgi:hypothetical protein